jgi:hypothetical protein
MLHEPNTVGTLTDIIELEQETSTLFNLSNISNIQILSNSLGVNADKILADSGQALSSSVLYDFSVDKDSDFGNEQVFSIAEMPYKKVSLASVSKLDTIDISVRAIYSNGNFVNIKLPSGARFQIRLSFFE